MFKYKHNRIVSDQGFEIDKLGNLIGFRYIEGDRAYYIDSERGFERGLQYTDQISFFPRDIYPWDAEHNDITRVDEETRRRIVANIQRAFDAVGIVWDTNE